MRKVLLAALLALLPGMVGAQSSGVNRYPSSGGALTVVAVNRTTVATAGTNQESLHSLTVPANSLKAIGDWCEISTVFLAAANNNSKTAQHYWGTTAGTSIATFATTFNNARFDLRTRCTRVSATVAYCTAWAQGGSYTSPGSVGSYAAPSSVDFSSSLTFTVAATTALGAGDLSAITTTVSCVAAPI